MPLFSKGQDKFKYSFSCSAYLLSEYVHIVCLFFLKIVISTVSWWYFLLESLEAPFLSASTTVFIYCLNSQSSFAVSSVNQELGMQQELLDLKTTVYHTSQKSNQMINRQRNAAAASNTLPFYREIVTPVTHSILSATEMRRNYHSLTHLSFILL